MTGLGGDTPDELDALGLREQLVAPNGPYAALDVVASTGSTNADLLAAAEQGAADRTVLIADEQTAGRGRRDRTLGLAARHRALPVRPAPAHRRAGRTAGHRSAWSPASRCVHAAGEAGVSSDA